MSLFEPASPLWTARALAALRIAAGLIFLMAGTMKMFGFPPPPTFGPKLVLIPPMWELHLAAILEIVGGVALLAGFLTRPVAFILSGEMAVAYWQVHNPISPFPTTSGGMPAAIFCFVFLYLAFAGAGAWSIDSMIARSRSGASL
ncbi:MAG TPA: DoxX family protein [Gemmatimonadaceae bacterium]|nr:DoxX family protein [Gemmatimonadaceae bacterium]